VVKTAAAMRGFGRELGQLLGKGSLVCLFGNLGAGKTTLTQGIGAGVGISPREIASASFVLCAEHHGGRLPLYHVDLYRLEPEQVAAMGLDEYFTTDGVTVVEWAERATGLLPKKRVDIRIGAEGRLRTVCLEAPRGYLRAEDGNGSPGLSVQRSEATAGKRTVKRPVGSGRQTVNDAGGRDENTGRPKGRRHSGGQ